MPSRQLLVATTFVVLLVLFAAVPARAGYYTVPGTCGQWGGWGGGQVVIFPACPDLVARNIGQPGNSPYGHYGGWRFDAHTRVLTLTVDGGNYQPTDRVLPRTQSLGVAENRTSLVSADHCQEGTDKRVFKLSVLRQELKRMYTEVAPQSTSEPRTRRSLRKKN